MTYSLNDIKKIISEDKKKKQGKYYARNYYNYRPNENFPDMSLTYEKDIVDENGNVKTITRDRTPFMYTNYTKLLVNQKVDYILAQEPTIKGKFEKYTIVDIADMLEDMALTASLDITSWLFIYVEDNILQWILIPDTQIIPIKDKYGKNIIEIIRYYETKESQESKDYITNVEVWNLEGVKTYKYKESNDNFLFEGETEPHYKELYFYDGELECEEAKTFDFIPFIPMYNNKNLENDITAIKDLLDFYNMVKSGFVANIFKFQEALTKLRGFAGDDKFLEQTQKQMLKYKMIALSDPDSDAEYMSVEIPTEAREILLNSIKENIFKIGQGIDPDKIGDGNITNIVIKNRYSQLNMKSDKTIKQLKIFYEKFIDCLDSYYNTKHDKEISFNKSINWNDSELIDNCLKSVGIISDETIRENHPFVKDEKEETRRIEKEEKDKIDKYNNDIMNQNNNINQNVE